MRTTRFMLAVTVLAAACAPASETAEQRTARLQAESDSARTAVQAQTAAMQAHMNAAHWDSLGQFYADNAVSMPPNAPALTGRAAIIDGMKQMLAPMSNLQIHFTSQSVSASGDMAVERGRYHMTFNMGRRAMADSGKYLTHWHKVDGRWVTVEEIFNSDVPVPGGN